MALTKDDLHKLVIKCLVCENIIVNGLYRESYNAPKQEQ